MTKRKIVKRDAAAHRQLGLWTKRVEEAVWRARVTCRAHGFALAVHGSLRRDVDVIAVPWTPDATLSPRRLAKLVLDDLMEAKLATGWTSGEPDGEGKPHGRRGFGIVLKGDPFLYMDISILPPRKLR